MCRSPCSVVPTGLTILVRCNPPRFLVFVRQRFGEDRQCHLGLVALEREEAEVGCYSAFPADRTQVLDQLGMNSRESEQATESTMLRVAALHQLAHNRDGR